MGSKRVFANNNNNINFNDYLKNKNGVEIIKNIKSKPHYNKNINIFFNYEKFILLTKAYFRSFLKSPFRIEIPVDIYNSNVSFIVYKSMLSHIEDCNECKYNKDIVKICECNKIKGILYPYGKYIEYNTASDLFMHKRLNLDDICKQQYCNNINDILLDSKTNIIEMFPSQNSFVFQNTQNKNYIQDERMNAYATYPNIKNCDKKKYSKNEISDNEIPDHMGIDFEKKTFDQEINVNTNNKLKNSQTQTQTPIQNTDETYNDNNNNNCGCSKYKLCKKTRPLFIN